MKQELLQRLRCPISEQPLILESLELDEAGDGWLTSKDGNHRYPIRNHIPRFVPESNYADNFGMQWNYFSKTQLDSHSGHSITADRFWKATGWNPTDMKDKWVLDAGCGSGRFAEIALSSGAHVIALDYSSAVDACWDNLKHHPNLYVVQADIYALPFDKASFDYIYSLGVLQHTPDVNQAFNALPPMLSVDGGKICVDFYEKSLKSRLLPKFWLRPITKRMNKESLFRFVNITAPILLPISRALSQVPVIGNLLKRLIPVANYYGILPLSDKQMLEWAILDTFDWLSPTYDNPQTANTVRAWLESQNLAEIEIL